MLRWAVIVLFLELSKPFKKKPKYRELEEWEIVNAPYEMPPFSADLKKEEYAEMP